MNVLTKLAATIAALAVPAILAISSPASASTVNILGDGNFEPDGTSSWAWNDPSGHTFVVAYNGNHMIESGAEVPAIMYQNVATTIGRTYTLSFDLSALVGNYPGADFKAGVDLLTPSAQTLLDLTTGSVTGDSNNFNWTNYVLTFTATGKNTEIDFSFLNPVAAWVIDNAVLTENDVATTPLPAALPMFMSGLGLIGFVAWRNKRGGFARSIAA
jgi:hypothetical protein